MPAHRCNTFVLFTALTLALLLLFALPALSQQQEGSSTPPASQAEFNASRSAADLGTVDIGSSTATTITATITTAATLGSIQVLTQGAPNRDYTLASGGSCTPGKSYAANGTCTVDVEFTPRYPGTRSGAVVLFNTSDNVMATVYLEGIGSGPQTTFSAGREQLIANKLFLPSILLDQNGNIYIAPGSGTEITKETPSGSGYTRSTLSLNGRIGPLAIDGAGNFFLADSGVLYKETRSSNGYVESKIGAGLSQVAVNDVAVDGNGSLYLVTYPRSGGIEIVMEAPELGRYTSSVLFDGAVNCNARNGSGLDSCASSLAVDTSGNVYVTLNGQVLELSPEPDSYTQKWIVAGLSYPAGIAVDATGNLFIADTGNGRVVKETPLNGSYVQTIVPTRRLSYPTQVALDQAGNIFIVDSYGVNLLNQQLLKENYSTPPSLTFAATAPDVASSDSPRTVIVTNDGNVALNFSAVGYPNDFPDTTGVPGACTPSTSLPAGANCVLTINFAPESLPGNDENPFGVRGHVAILTDTLNVAATTQEIMVNGQETRAPNTLYIDSTPNPSQAGSSVKFTAVVEGAAAGPVPTGSVTFFSACIQTYVACLHAGELAKVSLTGGVASFSTSALSQNTYKVFANYSGDSVYAPAKSNTIVQLVGMSIPVLTLTPSASSSFVGSTSLLTAKVTGVPNHFGPRGTVTFFNGATNLGSATLVPEYRSGVAPTSAATLYFSFPAAGTQTVTASYSGDSNYVPVTSLNGIDVTVTLLARIFGSAPPLTAGSITPVTVTIPSAATLTRISVLTLGVPNRDFTQAAGGTCSVGEAYAQGATCTVKVAFNPTHAGIHYGALTVMDSTSSTTAIATVYLQGTLDAPQLAFSSNPFNSLGSVSIFPYTPLTDPSRGGVAVDPRGNVFVAAVYTGYYAPGHSGYGVTKWTRVNGRYTQTSLTPSGGPGIALDGSGNLFVACGTALCELSPQPDGSYSQSALTGFKYLYGVAIDGAGNLYLTDSSVGALYKETLQPDGTYLQSTIDTGLIAPEGLALDSRGDIAVANANPDLPYEGPCCSSVLEEALSGSEYSRSTVSSNDLTSPVSVTFDASGTLFFAGDIAWAEDGDGCSSSSIEPVGEPGVWQATPEPGNTWLQTQVYLGSSEEVILNDNATGDLYLVDTGLTPNTCYGIWGQLYARSAVPAAPLGFGSVLFGAASSPQTVSVYNQGNQPLNFSSIHFPTDFPETPGVATECKAGKPLPAAASCTLTIEFKPSAAVTKGSSTSLEESVKITSDTRNKPGTVQTVVVKGTELK